MPDRPEKMQTQVPEPDSAATDFAQWTYQCFDGGSVLLQTDAPADSIICAPRFHTRQMNYGEWRKAASSRRRRDLAIFELFRVEGLRLLCRFGRPECVPRDSPLCTSIV